MTRSAAPRRSWLLAASAGVLVAVGMASVGWVGYQYVGSNAVSQRAFDTQRRELRETWAAPPERASGTATPMPEPSTRVIPGEAIALLRIPALGPAYEVPILSGTEQGTLARGVGHYAGTAGPGELGNFALAGHRVTHGRPFGRLLELDPGDEILVETRAALFRYVIDVPPRDLTVRDTDIWVLDPVPGEPGARPERALLTLTTCQDLVNSPDRSVGFAHLAGTTTKR